MSLEGVVETGSGCGRVQTRQILIHCSIDLP